MEDCLIHDCYIIDGDIFIQMVHMLIFGLINDMLGNQWKIPDNIIYFIEDDEVLVDLFGSD